jgi:hypothetical protein
MTLDFNFGIMPMLNMRLSEPASRSSTNTMTTLGLVVAASVAIPPSLPPDDAVEK